MKYIEKLIKSGILLIPLSIFMLYKIKILGTNPAIVILLSTIPTLLVMADNSLNLDNQSNKEKRKAQHPPITSELLFKRKPVGYPLGMYKGYYVCMSFDSPGNHNILINGSSGTGKSAKCIVNSILLSKSLFLMGKDPHNKHESIHYLISDVKGELSNITRCKGDGSILFNPAQRKGHGFDPLWGLDENSSEQEIKERMETIAISIIPVAHGDNAIWGDAARNLLTGLLIHFYMYPKVGELNHITSKPSLPSLLKMIASGPIKDIVKEVNNECSPTSAVHMYISSYDGMATETLSSVEFNLRNVLSKLVTDRDIIYALDTNPRKFNPSDILKHSIYVVIPMNRIDSYGIIWTMISNLCLKFVMGLPEKSKFPNRPYFGFIFDEAGAIYSATKTSPEILISALKLIRSKGGVIICANQDIPSYGSVMDDRQLHSFLGNFQFMLILDAIDSYTQKEFSDLLPKYSKKIRTISGSGSKSKTTTSTHEANIYDKSDLASLGRKDEMILISPACVSDNKDLPNPGFATIRKIPYYQDKYFSVLYKIVKNQIHLKKNF